MYEIYLVVGMSATFQVREAAKISIFYSVPATKRGGGGVKGLVIKEKESFLKL